MDSGWLDRVLRWWIVSSGMHQRPWLQLVMAKLCKRGLGGSWSADAVGVVVVIQELLTLVFSCLGLSLIFFHEYLY